MRLQILSVVHDCKNVTFESDKSVNSLGTDRTFRHDTVRLSRTKKKVTTGNFTIKSMSPKEAEFNFEEPSGILRRLPSK